MHGVAGAHTRSFEARLSHGNHACAALCVIVRLCPRMWHALLRLYQQTSLALALAHLLETAYLCPPPSSILRRAAWGAQQYEWGVCQQECLRTGNA